MWSDSRFVGELLVTRKVLSRDVLEQLLLREQETGVRFERLVIAEGIVSERDLVAATAEYRGLASWNPLDHTIPPMVRGMIPADMARKLQAVVVGSDGGHLIVAMADPTDVGAADQVSQHTGWLVRPAMVASADLRELLDEMYRPDGPVTATDELVPDPGPASPHLNVLLTRMVELGASDLHLSNGRPPSVRIDGVIRPLDDYPVMLGSELRDLMYAVLTERQRGRFEADRELDTSHSIPGVGRFRVNVFLQRDSVGAVIRAIPHTIVSLERLGMPPVFAELTKVPRGLILVTGPTGSGKSTTLASMIDVINTTRAVHIMTVEDPIEFLHEHKLAVVNQREVGEDTHSFAEALRHSLRQDPDVILVGEMRDLETISTALTAAETGHLVFGTLHTQDAPQSIDRIIDVFPAHQQQQVRVQLSSALQAVVTQQLLRRNAPQGRVVASEVMVVTPAVRNLIREGKIHQLYSVMQGGGQHGMRTMDHSLAELVRANTITMETAIEHCHNEDDLRRLVSTAR
jgi:twitching motility protein PilT